MLRRVGSAIFCIISWVGSVLWKRLLQHVKAAGLKIYRRFVYYGRLRSSTYRRVKHCYERFLRAVYGSTTAVEAADALDSVLRCIGMSPLATTVRGEVAPRTCLPAVQSVKVDVTEQNRHIVSH